MVMAALGDKAYRAATLMEEYQKNGNTVYSKHIIV